jgi:chlorobactene glucosyltransferase
LLSQCYENYEIITINDCSSDNTGKILYEYHKNNPKLIVVVDLKSKPDEWTGKNWVCYQGYLKTTGDILLFIDAGTIHAPDTIHVAIRCLLQERLDALTHT